MRIGIIQFPGSNCERETALAVKRAGMEPVEFLWNEPREKLRSLDGYIIVGGFSYEDRSRAGIIAALDPVMEEIKAQSEQGKPILGICNGAQILVETGLVPGVENNKLAMVLTDNKRVANGKILGTGYYNAWITMRLSDIYQRNAFTKHLTPKDILSLPVAHAEGRFVMSPALWQELEVQGQALFQYCAANGEVIDEFPINPNGSSYNIAAISNKTGNVLAIMPHPERTPNGDLIFRSMRDYIAERQNHPIFPSIAPLNYYPRRSKLQQYQSAPNSDECIVELIITDNQALTVQNTLHQLGLPLTVKRYTHWEIQYKSEDGGGDDYQAILNQIKAIEVLFNPRKERIAAIAGSDPLLCSDGTAPAIDAHIPVRDGLHIREGLTPPSSLNTKEGQPPSSLNAREGLTPSSSAAFLIQSKDDLIGQQKLQTLKDHFAIQGIKAIHHRILWCFSSKDGTITPLIEPLLNTNIIGNPYAHDCYRYDFS